ncbi:LLM class flavin-dependent oxidoreductase [Oceanobacter sp. 3_MG-2023]|uniref:LLM class flavin-dependent oxidoreductase n=1 Tax=Oceanobacter sp. 3_MG-2023 TaxID=3062622 RepID=UPI0027340509|nr:LLM class flavin-dependent oxidoreductase [Oceanobacter sp. 3_MG-2023]MDP2505537.1 LLM class flavin-dependent oxidoreductase [Oceanobacter sp. 3_MG-2023]
MKFGLWLPVYGGWLRLLNHRPLPDFEQCARLAVQAEHDGFDYLYGSENLLNCVYGKDAEVADPWIFAAGIATLTQRIELVVASKPGFCSPLVAAQMARSLQQMSRGRCSVNIVCGWWPEEFRQAGVDYLDHAGRYRRANEYCQSLQRFWGVTTATAAAEFFSAEVAPPVDKLEPVPPIWVGGQSETALAMARRYGETIFLNSMPIAELRETIANIRSTEAAEATPLKIAVSAFVLMAATDHEAQARYQALQSQRDDALVDELRTAMDESGASSWEGLSKEKMLDSNCGFDIGLVGSTDTIAARLRELNDAGVDVLMCQFEDMVGGSHQFAQQVMQPFHSLYTA